MSVGFYPIRSYLEVFFIHLDSDEVTVYILTSYSGSATTHCEVQYGFSFVRVCFY